MQMAATNGAAWEWERITHECHCASRCAAHRSALEGSSGEEGYLEAPTTGALWEGRA